MMGSVITLPSLSVHAVSNMCSSCLSPITIQEISSFDLGHDFKLNGHPYREFYLDFDRRDGGTLNRAQENATQGIADGVTIAGLKGLSDELGVGRRGAVLHLGEFIGQFELSEAFWHGGECLLR